MDFSLQERGKIGSRGYDETQMFHVRIIFLYGISSRYGVQSKFIYDFWR